MNWDATDFCLLASGVVLVMLALRAAEKWGPFKASVATIFLTWVMVHTVWLSWRHTAPIGIFSHFLIVYMVVKLWTDLFTRFPPGGRRAVGAP